MLVITPIYTAIAIALYTALAFTVIRQRHRRRISLGDNDVEAMRRIVRAHGNFAEYVPIVLIAMGGAELAGAPAPLVHASGVLMLTGRLLHGYCFLFMAQGLAVRVAGMMLTFVAMWLAAGSGLAAVI